MSTTAFEALINLVEMGSLGTNTALSNFILMLDTLKLVIHRLVIQLTLKLVIFCRNEAAVTSAIGNLLILDLKRHNGDEKYICPFTLKSCQHPLITILINHEHIWMDVIDQIHFIMNHNHPKYAKLHILSRALYR